MCRSFKGLAPSVPPKTKRLFSTVVQVWLSLGEGATPFVIGLLHVFFTTQEHVLKRIKDSEYIKHEI